jgi:glycopeptide antibiotics resistance protein
LITVSSRLRFYQVLWAISAIIGICADTLPASDFVGHPHWRKVVWVPFTGAPFSLLDIIENVLLLVPFGFFGMLSGYAGRSKVRLVIAGMLLGAAGEFYQVFCHNRYPSITDLLCNTTGAFIGAVLGTVGTPWRRQRSLRPG